MNENIENKQDLYYRLGGIESSVTSLREYMKAQFDNLNEKIEANNNTHGKEIQELKIKHEELKKRVDALYIKIATGVGIFSILWILFSDYLRGLI